MSLAIVAICGGLGLLVWSANKFIDGAASTALHLGMSPLLIGMLVVGFGTSAPEMVVSAMAASDDNPDLALGNALGSNIVNTGLILGITALVTPVIVNSKIVLREIPLLLTVGVLSGVIYWNGALTRIESSVLLIGFLSVIGWSIFNGLKSREDKLTEETSKELSSHPMPLRLSILWLFIGLICLIVSSRILVWGAVEVATSLGVSELIIGLTIVALGTSLPELAASIIAVKKSEHDIAIGNIVGSNMFNLLAVVGIAGIINPIEKLPDDVLIRDWPVMMGMIFALFLMAYNWKKGQGKVNRLEGGLLLTSFIAYYAWLIYSMMA